MRRPLTLASLQKTVTQALKKQPIIDMHTHLYPPTFGTPVPNKSGKVDPNGLLLWGLDELLTYHYLVAEVFRVVPATKLSYEDFWKMPKTAQADHIFIPVFLAANETALNVRMNFPRGLLRPHPRGNDPGPGFIGPRGQKGDEL